MILFLLKLFFFVSFFICSLLTISILRYHLYYSYTDKEIVCNNTELHPTIEYSNELIERFSQAIRFKTITNGINQYNASELIKLMDWIEKNYPNLHKAKFVKLEKVSKYSLLYTLQGNDVNLKPYLLSSHLDVVPVEQDKWTFDAFEGKIHEGYLYGRGTIDIKDSLVGILECLEYLIKHKNFVPKRTIILAFGHDEEGVGVEGAFEIAKILQTRYRSLEYILDEGSFIMEKSLPGVAHNLAFVSVGEKGYVTVELTAKGEPGHSSMPNYETAINKIAKVVSKFNSKSFPSQFGKGPEVKLLETLSSQSSFPFNYIYSNIWLFKPFLDYFFSTSPVGNALIRTTSAVTIISSGLKENILPTEAKVYVNHRIHPLESVEQVVEYDKNLINDHEIEIKISQNISFEAHPFSPYDENAFGYNVIKKSVNEIFENVVVVPGVMVGSTDSKHYLSLTKNIYRFTPILLGENDLKRFHGHDERINLKNYYKLVNFYAHVILASDQPSLKKKIK